MAVIRLMEPKDVDSVRWVESQAFESSYRKAGRLAELGLRTRENILAGLAINPTGCFVAEEKGVIAGIIFTRLWGSVGWAGAFGVLPGEQGKGIGKALLGTARDYLAATSCETVGLETNSENHKNVGMYVGWGFRPVYSTLSLVKDVHPPEHSPAYQVKDSDDNTIQKISDVSSRVWRGLDYSPEAINAVQFGWGKTILMGENDFWGAGVIRTTTRREETTGCDLEISCLAIMPEMRDHLDQVVMVLEDYAAAHGFSRLRIPFNTSNWPALLSLNLLGFRTVSVMMRMLLRGKETADQGIEFSRWAM
jgi:ribosomal protein S18 acetylase RimI-like enzyme